MPSVSLSRLLDALDACRTRFGPGEAVRTEKLLAEAADLRFEDARPLIRFHEILLFLRAYPHSPEVARRTEELLRTIPGAVARLESSGASMAPFEDPSVSGIGGTTFAAIFSYPVARRLAELHPRALRIDWQRHARPARLGNALPRWLPLLEEESLVSYDVPYLDWLREARGAGSSDLAWLMRRLDSLPATDRERAEIYDALELPLEWKPGGTSPSRTGMRIGGGRVFIHEAPLLRRSAVSLDDEMARPPLPVRRVPPRQGRRLLDRVLETSAVRYRELHGFSHGDPRRVLRASAGRGVEILLLGLPPASRLPLRAYHAASVIKNGVPAGYVEGISLAGCMEIGFNLYYTFRAGETAWIYARLLRLFRQLLGVDYFYLDPYQIGYHNEEAIESGAFWFYRKLGFRPVRPGLAAAARKEELKLAGDPGYRTPRRVLRRLSAGPMIYEAPGAAPGLWDAFSIRAVGLAVQRAMAARYEGDAARMRRASFAGAVRALGLNVAGWTAPERAALESLAPVLTLIPDLGRWSEAEKRCAARVIRAKAGPDEARFLRLMQRHERLTDGLRRLGSSSLV